MANAIKGTNTCDVFNPSEGDFLKMPLSGLRNNVD